MVAQLSESVARDEDATQRFAEGLDLVDAWVVGVTKAKFKISWVLISEDDDSLAVVCMSIGYYVLERTGLPEKPVDARKASKREVVSARAIFKRARK